MAATTAAAVAEGQVIGCHTIELWEEQLKKANETKQLVVIDFTASWCPPCRMIAPILAEIAKKLPHVMFLKVDVDELKQVAQDWAVEAMPTFKFMKEGTIVDTLVGADKVKLENMIKAHAS